MFSVRRVLKHRQMSQVTRNQTSGYKTWLCPVPMPALCYPTDSMYAHRALWLWGDGAVAVSSLTQIRLSSFPSLDICHLCPRLDWHRADLTTAVCAQQDGQQQPGQQERGGEWQLHLQLQDVHQLGLPDWELRHGWQQIRLHHHQLQGSHLRAGPLPGELWVPPVTGRVLPAGAWEIRSLTHLW